MKMNKVQKYTLIIILAWSIAITSLYTIFIWQPWKIDIHKATIYDLTKTYHVKNKLANKIIIYLDNNPNAKIDDLVEIYGIGDERIKFLKSRFK